MTKTIMMQKTTKQKKTITTLLAKNQKTITTKQTTKWSKKSMEMMKS